MVRVEIVREVYGASHASALLDSAAEGADAPLSILVEGGLALPEDSASLRLVGLWPLVFIAKRRYRALRSHSRLVVVVDLIDIVVA